MVERKPECRIHHHIPRSRHSRCAVDYRHLSDSTSYRQQGSNHCYEKGDSQFSHGAVLEVLYVPANSAESSHEADIVVMVNAVVFFAVSTRTAHIYETETGSKLTM